MSRAHSPWLTGSMGTKIAALPAIGEKKNILAERREEEGRNNSGRRLQGERKWIGSETQTMASYGTGWEPDDGGIRAQVIPDPASSATPRCCNVLRALRRGALLARGAAG